MLTNFNGTLRRVRPLSDHLAGNASHFIKMTVVLLAVALAACQSTSPTQPKTDDSAIVGKLTIDIHDMNYSPAKLNVPHAGRYQVEVTNRSQNPHDIVFSNDVQLPILATGKKNQSYWMYLRRG